MEVFTQFSSDLDENTKKQLAHGRALMELLKQPLSFCLAFRSFIEDIIYIAFVIFIVSWILLIRVEISLAFAI